MAKANGRSRAQSDYEDNYPERVAAWLAQHGSLIDALISLRRLGDQGEAAVDAVLETVPLLNLRLSWELWESVLEGGGGDPAKIWRRVLPITVTDRVRYAVWGTPWGDDGRPQLRSVAA